MITKAQLQDFTIFRDLEIAFAPGINVLLGENGTGKTHLMKLLYSACSIVNTKEPASIEQKLQAHFLPDSIGRLRYRTQGRGKAIFQVWRQNKGEAKERSIKVEITSQDRVKVEADEWHEDRRTKEVYIPVKDMLANAPGFLSLYENHVIHFEGVYAEIIKKAFFPPKRGPRDRRVSHLLEMIEEQIGGKVVTEGETFYLHTTNTGKFEFTLVAEGYRKLGLLYALIQNGLLSEGSILFWDEPEANLNPKLAETVIQILAELANLGVQIFLTTHDSTILSELELLRESGMPIQYHLLTKNLEEQTVALQSGTDLETFEGNPIYDAGTALLQRQIVAELEQTKQSHL